MAANGVTVTMAAMLVCSGNAPQGPTHGLNLSLMSARSVNYETHTGKILAPLMSECGGDIKKAEICP